MIDPLNNVLLGKTSGFVGQSTIYFDSEKCGTAIWLLIIYNGN